jgi:SAM-dependent methyltransferase
MTCAICGNSQGNEMFIAREMMLGTREKFEYFQCSRCKCLQIKDIPADMAPYYPGDQYHSFAGPEMYFNNRLKNVVKGLRDHLVLSSGKAIRNRIIKWGKVDTLLPVVAELSIRRSSAILDIGCGAGVLLYALRNAGYKNVLGIDPYIADNIHYKNGLQILKQSVGEHKGNYDIVMMHHSLEHMPDQHEVMKAVHQILRTGGKFLVRIPLVSEAWELYRTNWVQLDAPRHFFLHSELSFKKLAENTGFRIEKLLYDSSSFQFWGSELYKRDIPLTMELGEYFSPEELSEFAQMATELNHWAKGDQAAFILVK